MRHGDIVVGNNEGAIYVLHDTIKPCKVKTDPKPTKMHWHRMAVSSVKWALDGAFSSLGITRYLQANFDAQEHMWSPEVEKLFW